MPNTGTCHDHIMPVGSVPLLFSRIGREGVVTTVVWRARNSLSWDRGGMSLLKENSI